MRNPICHSGKEKTICIFSYDVMIYMKYLFIDQFYLLKRTYSIYWWEKILRISIYYYKLFKIIIFINLFKISYFKIYIFL